MAMWDCDDCINILDGVAVCPMCGKERPVPKTTSAGPSNDWEPDVEPQEAVEATVEPAPEPVVLKPRRRTQTPDTAA